MENLPSALCLKSYFNAKVGRWAENATKINCGLILKSYLSFCRNVCHLNAPSAAFNSLLFFSLSLVNKVILSITGSCAGP